MSQEEEVERRAAAAERDPEHLRDYREYASLVLERCLRRELAAADYLASLGKWLTGSLLVVNLAGLAAVAQFAGTRLSALVPGAIFVAGIVCALLSGAATWWNAKSVVEAWRKRWPEDIWLSPRRFEAAAKKDDDHESRYAKSMIASYMFGALSIAAFVVGAYCLLPKA